MTPHYVSFKSNPGCRHFDIELCAALRVSEIAKVPVWRTLLGERNDL